MTFRLGQTDGGARLGSTDPARLGGSASATGGATEVNSTDACTSSETVSIATTTTTTDSASLGESPSVDVAIGAADSAGASESESVGAPDLITSSDSGSVTEVVNSTDAQVLATEAYFVNELEVASAGDPVAQDVATGTEVTVLAITEEPNLTVGISGGSRRRMSFDL